MRRSVLIVATAVLAVVSTPVLADQSPSSSDSMPMMQNMHEHMKGMRATMQQIKAAKTPEERQRLMQAHREAMRQGMAMMSKMGNGEHQGGERHGAKAAHDHPAECKDDDARCQQMQSMQAAQKHMRGEMQMMRMMMEQMMEHQMAGEKQAQ